MYYVLTYLPPIIWLAVAHPSIIKINIAEFCVVIFFVEPIYLLLINAVYILKKDLKFYKGLIYMVSIPMINWLYIIRDRLIDTGTFAGETPLDFFFSIPGIPLAIILIGTMVIYLLKKLFCKH